MIVLEGKKTNKKKLHLIIKEIWYLIKKIDPHADILVHIVFAGCIVKIILVSVIFSLILVIDYVK